ncbi:matrixin family metalloprotease [Marimonas arenosa]|uniref:Matrixin family metalloprotease n=1 Tax=Marimonas arenosa TaxID=1795305 RepID=A0AAE3WGS1_9RHOB|nr:matrixin family metalloprotease [Marimonas arenosa]MDQ2091517.1 matrixin family metalloprotease [Marimonas arenosa]
MPTFVSDYTAIVSGWSWSETEGTPTVVTYSFETSAPGYLSDSYSQAFIDSFVPFTQTEIGYARQALAMWAAVSGIVFVEVSAGEGDIRFGNYDLDYSSHAGSGAFAYYPGRSLYSYNTYDSELAGDVFMGVHMMNSSWVLHGLLHEIGHAIGLEHPHGGEIQLEDAYDNGTYTVMSYSGQRQELGEFDDDAVTFIYGPATFTASTTGGIEAFAVDEAAFTTTQTWGHAGSEIAGTSLHDSIMAGGGNDLVGGFRGDDLLHGGGGQDTLIGSEGADTLIGGAGDDRLIGGPSSSSRSGTDWVSFAGTAADVVIDLGVYESGDYVSGQATGSATGTDSLYGIDNAIGGGGSDGITGNGWNNVLEGRAGNDTLWGFGGDDTLRGGSGRDRLLGEAGDDVLVGGGWHDTMLGGNGEDRLEGGPGNDVLRGNGGFDTIIGGSGSDVVYGGVQADRVLGGLGQDRLFGGDGRDTIEGGAGNDLLRGEVGHDRLNGGLGDDSVYGGTQDDVVMGGPGNDLVAGGSGYDRVAGGAGNDVLTGGSNADRFLFSDGHGDDTITDFNATNDAEKIDLSAVSAIDSLADLDLSDPSNGAATQVGADVLIDTGAGNSITLENVLLADLDGNDFIF